MRIRLSLVALAGATSMASAADLPVRTDPPAPAPVSAPLFTNMAADWTGGYVGATANVRRSAGESSLRSFNYLLPANGAIANNPVDPNNETYTLTQAAKSKSTMPFGAGLFGGYNMQSGMFVYGVEADANYTMDRSRSRSNATLDATGEYSDVGLTTTDTLAATGPLTTSQVSRLKWDGSLRLRAGVLAAPSMLVYATGGLAVGRISTSTGVNGVVTFLSQAGATQATHTFSGTTENSKISMGWTLGAGVDYRLTDAWTLRAEYRYTDFGRKTTTASRTPVCAETQVGACTNLGVPAATVSTSAREAFHAVKVGVAYQFGGNIMQPSAILARY
jgi:outer membrane immunogenic protein